MRKKLKIEWTGVWTADNKPKITLKLIKDMEKWKQSNS